MGEQSLRDVGQLRRLTLTPPSGRVVHHSVALNVSRQSPRVPATSWPTAGERRRRRSGRHQLVREIPVVDRNGPRTTARGETLIYMRPHGGAPVSIIGSCRTGPDATQWRTDRGFWSCQQFRIVAPR